MEYKQWALENMCSTTKSEESTIADIIYSITNNKPLSYTRFGDGEISLLKEYFKIFKDKPEFITLCDADKSIERIPIWDIPNTSIFTYYSNRNHNNVINENYFKNRFGVSDEYIKMYIIKIIGESILFALQNSTHIGIWDINKVVNEYSFKDFCLYGHSYTPLKQLFTECEVDFNKLTGVLLNRNEILSNPLEFKKILNGKPIHIFTSNADRLKNVAKLHEILDTSITYTNLTPTKKDWLSHSFANHSYLYDRCKEVKEQVVLYSLGAGAKYIPAHLSKNYSKTVIDMGAVLDGWAGKITRPYMKDERHMLTVKEADIIESYPWLSSHKNY